MKKDSLSAIKEAMKEITLPILQQLNILKAKKKRFHSIRSSAKNLYLLLLEDLKMNETLKRYIRRCL
jgi:hypothetical protein